MTGANTAAPLPIVWVPGHLCGAWLYAAQIARFGTAHPTVIADTTRDDSIAGMASRLVDCAPERFILAGLSMGGMVAMEVLAQAPGRVAGVLLMDTDPTAARAKEIEWRSAQSRRVLRQGLAPYVREFVAKFFRHDPAVAQAHADAVEQLMREVPLKVFENQARALDSRRDMTELLPTYRGPVEIVVGAEDRVCPPRLHAHIKDALPDAPLTVLPGVGHLASIEAPDAVNERLAALIRRVDGDPAKAGRSETGAC